MTYIGQVEPWEPAPGILGLPLETPRWHVLTAMSQHEGKAAAKLSRLGIEETWFPTETAWRPARGKKQREPYERLIAPGYLFVLASHELLWFRLFDMMRGLITGVVGNEAPRVIPEETIAKMRLVPKRIEILREQETAREKAARLARLPQPGHAARLTVGPFAGRLVQVERIDRGIAAFLLEGIPGTAQVEKLERAES